MKAKACEAADGVSQAFDQRVLARPAQQPVASRRLGKVDGITAARPIAGGARSRDLLRRPEEMPEDAPAFPAQSRPPHGKLLLAKKMARFMAR